MRKYAGIFLILTLLTYGERTAINAAAVPDQLISADVRSPKITSHKFQVNFLNELAKLVNVAALENIDDFLRELQKNPKYQNYQPQFEEILQSNVDKSDKKLLDEKIIFMKQLLDIKKNGAENEPAGNLLNFFALRNVRFLRKLRLHLNEIQEDSAREMRDLKAYEMCRQFHEESGIEDRALERSIFAHIKLAPLAEQLLLQHVNTASNSSSSKSLNATRPHYISLEHFGSTLYERVKTAGSELIDDYLNTIRKLLIEVIEEKPTNARHSDKLSKVLHKIDAILQITDFAEKRESLYAYLQTNLAQDFEEFKTSEHAQADLAEMLLKLKRRGLDMFMTFLFSNFEFLERLHAEWHALAESMQGGSAELNELREVHKLYVDFKHDSEDTSKYDAYILSVKQLYERTKLAKAQQPLKVFEILHNSSQNVGSVTLNMIKGKCDEL